VVVVAAAVMGVAVIVVIVMGVRVVSHRGLCLTDLQRDQRDNK
jgi:hypothetical protein